MTTLEPAKATTDWASLKPSQMVDHLVATHHTYLREALPRISQLLDRVTEAHGERNPELHGVTAAFDELRGELEPHLLKEEQVLFPMIRQLYSSEGLPSFHCGSLRNPISVMCFEHDRAEELLAILRAQTADFAVPADTCQTYGSLLRELADLETDTLLHIRKENDWLFPAVVAEELRRAKQ